MIARPGSSTKKEIEIYLQCRWGAMLKKQWEEPVANVIPKEVQLEIGGVDLDRGSHDDLEVGPQTGNVCEARCRCPESVQNRQHSTVSTDKKI